MKKKIICFIMLIMLFTCLNCVSASTVQKYYPAGDNDNPTYLMRYEDCTDPAHLAEPGAISNGKGGRLHNFNAEQFIIDGNKIAYCLEIDVDINEGSGFNTTTDWSWYSQKYGSDVTAYIQKVMYYGYGYNGDTNLFRFLAAQELIWERQAHTEVTTIYAQPWGASHSLVTVQQVEDYKAEISNLVSTHQSLPSFAGHTFDVVYKNNITITDYNNKLSDYKISNAGGLDARIEGNSLVIGPNSEPGEHIVRLTKLPVNNKSTIVRKDSEQTLGYPGEDREFTADETYVKIRVLSGKITIKKLDSETGAVPQGDATLKDAIYNVKDRNGVIVDILTIGNDLTATSKNLPLGTYTVVESEASIGYNVSEEEYTVTLSIENPDATIEDRKSLNVTEVIKRNDIEIIKDIGATSNTDQTSLSGCEFTATLKSSIGTDNVISKKCEAPTDGNGYCIIKNLPYGTYVVEETTVSPMAMKCANFEVFVGEDKTERINPYTPSNGNFLPTTLGETEGTTKDYPASYEWLDDNGHIVDVAKVMKIRIRKVDYDRTEPDSLYHMQGDAKLEGAIYEIYRRNPETGKYTDYVYDITVKNVDGEYYAESGELLVGDYMVKEKIKSSEEGKDKKIYNYSYAKGYLVDPNEYYFNQDVQEQTVRKTFHEDESREKVIRGSIKVVKYDNQENNSSEDTNPSTEAPSAGAILRLVLNSSIPESAVLEEGKETEYYKQGTIWYEVKLDKDGYGEFMEANDATHSTSVDPAYGEEYADYKIGDIDGKYTYCCTIPYGEYTIIETKESDQSQNTSFYIQPKKVTLEKQTQIEYRIEEDKPVPMHIKIQKRDKDTGATVDLKGTKFKIWDCRNKKFVTQLSSEDAGFINIFETNEQGLITTPEELHAGDYIIYEVDPPKGYYWEEDLREPKDEKDIGVIGKGGKHIVIDKTAMEIRVDEISNDKYYFYTIDISDSPLKGKIEIIKKGEMLDGYTQKEVKIEANKTNYTVTNPVYELKGLEGVEYTITAKNDIKSPDGRVTYERAGTTHVITTDENGRAETDELYLGTYEIKETKTPLGYVTDKNIEDITLVNEDNTERVATITKELTNKKQKTQVEVEKVLENPEYGVKEDYIGIVIGFYANEDLQTADGRQVIAKNTLLDVVEGKINTTDLENGRNTIILTSNVNLPNNKTYYAKELYVDYPYEMETEKQVFEVKAKSTENEKLKVYGITINNELPTAAQLAFIKVSTSALVNEAEELKGGKLTQTEFDKLMDPVIKWVNRNPASTVKAVFNGEQEPDDPSVAKCRLDTKYTLSEATYSVYLDENKTQPLTRKGAPVTFTTDSNGYAELYEVPIGEYYIFEEKAPVLTFGDKKISYNKETKPIKVILSQLDKDISVARLLTDDMGVGKEFIKTDVFTGELVPNCTFEITNSDGEVIVNAKTDGEGKFSLNLDWFEEGETYFYKEISAPGIYDLNTEPHEFKIEFDENGELIKTEVENRRKTRDLLIRKTDAETGEALQGCVFTIAMVNEDGTQKVNAKTGEPIYLVENAVTDEKGEYYIEDAPMGTYMFTEITPPEGYELDEDLTGYTFTLDENSPELTIFEVTNTGDIAVIAVACIAVVSIVGITLVIRRNKKLQR